MRNSKRVSILAGGTAILMGVGVAFAFWTSSGTGTGSATTGSDVAWAVTTDAASGDALTPDGPFQTVGVHVKNENTGTQRLNSIAVSVANSDGSAWDGPGTCSAADYEITQFTVPADTDVLAGATYSDASVDVQMIDTGANQNDCRGVTVPLYVLAN